MSNEDILHSAFHGTKVALQKGDEVRGSGCTGHVFSKEIGFQMLYTDCTEHVFWEPPSL